MPPMADRPGSKCFLRRRRRRRPPRDRLLITLAHAYRRGPIKMYVAWRKEGGQRMLSERDPEGRLRLSNHPCCHARRALLTARRFRHCVVLFACAPLLARARSHDFDAGGEGLVSPRRVLLRRAVRHPQSRVAGLARRVGEIGHRPEAIVWHRVLALACGRSASERRRSGRRRAVPHSTATKSTFIGSMAVYDSYDPRSTRWRPAQSTAGAWSAIPSTSNDSATPSMPFLQARDEGPDRFPALEACRIAGATVTQGFGSRPSTPGGAPAGAISAGMWAWR